MTDEPTPDYADLAATALENAGINPDERLHQARDIPGDVAPEGGEQPALVEAEEDKVMYKITFDLPNAGLGLNAILADEVGAGKAPIEIPDVPMNNATTVAHIPDVIPAASTGRRYPTQPCRSAVGNQPYDTFSPWMAFLQLGETRAHRGVLNAIQYAGMTRSEQLHALVPLPSIPHNVNNVEHMTDLEMTTKSEAEIKVWTYMITQYNLKPSLQKFDARGAAAAVKELTQLHIMDTWTPMDPSKLGQEEKMKVLLSLLFLKEKKTGQIKGRACINGVPQWVYIPKEEAASPTMSTESTFITAAIAASKRRRVCC